MKIVRKTENIQDKNCTLGDAPFSPERHIGWPKKIKGGNNNC